MATAEEKLLNLARKGGNDASLVLFDDIRELEERVDKLEQGDPKEEQIAERLAKRLTKLEKGDKGDEPSDERLASLIAPLIPEPIVGPQGIEGKASTVAGPKGDRGPAGESIVGPRGATGPAGKNGSSDTPEQVRNKLEGLKKGNKLSMYAIEGLLDEIEKMRKLYEDVPKSKGGGGFSKIHMDRHFVDDETPSGTINGSNVTFTISKAPTTGSLKVYRGGARQKVGDDYTISGRTITFDVAPVVGETLLVDFRF